MSFWMGLFSVLFPGAEIFLWQVFKLGLRLWRVFMEVSVSAWSRPFLEGSLCNREAASSFRETPAGVFITIQDKLLQQNTLESSKIELVFFSSKSFKHTRASRTALPHWFIQGPRSFYDVLLLPSRTALGLRWPLSRVAFRIWNVSSPKGDVLYV